MVVAPIRNGRLAAGHAAAAGFTTLYVVPDQCSVILKQINLQNQDSVDGQINVLLDMAGGGASQNLLVLSLQAGLNQNWEGWIALDAGDTITLYASSAHTGYWLSGATLPYRPIP